MDNSCRYLFIFNPAANKGRAARKEEWLKSLLSGRKDAIVLTTAYSGHAGDIARSEARESTCMIACGGDGTLHEVVNAVTGQGVRVGILPIGSANDFIKTLNPHESLPLGVGHFFTGGSKSVDLGSVFYGDGDHQYFINSLGIGFTGRIARSVKQTRWLRGELVYLYALFNVFYSYTASRMRIKITLEHSLLELYEPIFAFSVSNGKIEGGKFRLAPEADLSDGLLDVCILKAIPKHELFRYVFKYLRGTHIYDPQVLYCKATAVEVMLEEADVMHIDGEVFDNVCGRIAVSVVPQGISLLQGITRFQAPKGRF
jgi:YegS/Rv2252/BmrU family lipid kinase